MGGRLFVARGGERLRRGRRALREVTMHSHRRDLATIMACAACLFVFGCGGDSRQEEPIDAAVDARTDAAPVALADFCHDACAWAAVCFEDSSGYFANDPVVCEPDCATNLAACSPTELGEAAACIGTNCSAFEECLLRPGRPLDTCHAD
jgi:hypothetical protein